MLSESEEKDLLGKVLWPSHEPLQFMRRRGGIRLDYEEYYRNYHKPENVKLWAKLLGKGGMERLHFYKGFGLKTEREEINRTIAVARIMHAQGMKVSVYVGGTMHTDSFFREVPKARAWAAVAADGGPITYMGYQLWRHFPCLNNPDFRRYYFKVLDVAIREVKADEIFFDNQILRGEPRSCRCKHCLKLFPKHVESKYTRQQRIERFGHPDVSLIRPPDWSESWPAGAVRTITDPVIQEWIDFRCRNVYDFYLTMREYITKQNPAIAVGMNIKGLHLHNIAFDNGIDHGRWQVPGFNCCDSGLATKIGPNKNMMAEFRSFKITHTTAMTQSGLDDDLGNLLCLVMTRQLDVPGFGRRPQNGRDANVYGRLGRFLREQEDELYGTRPIIADVAVLRSFPSMAYNCMNWIHGPMICEQGLWENRIPFQIIFDQNMNDLRGYKVILLANQESLSDENVERLARFVKNGGGIVATESTGQFDGWRRRRVKSVLAEVFGIAPGKPNRVAYGRGRVAYLPTIQPSAEYKNDPFRHPYASHESCLPPRNWNELAGALRWAAGGTFSFEVSAPFGIAAEFRAGPTAKDRVVHLINLTGKPIRKPITVRMAAAAGERWTLDVRSPEAAKATPLARRNGGVEFRLSGLGLYTACVLRR